MYTIVGVSLAALRVPGGKIGEYGKAGQGRSPFGSHRANGLAPRYHGVVAVFPERVERSMKSLGMSIRWPDTVTSIWRRTLPTARRALVDLVYPPSCAWCSVDLGQLTDGISLCEQCRELLAPEIGGRCRRCGSRSIATAASADECPRCRGIRLPWERAITLGDYRGDLSQAVIRTKRPHNEPLTMALGDLLFHERRKSLTEIGVDAIIPVPMHWTRRIARGTNGPHLIAESLASRMRVPLKSHWLRRTRLTPLQTDLPRTERIRSQRNSFKCRRASRIKDRSVLLVDDVLTTGATAAAAAQALLAAGAKSIFVAVIARSLGDGAV